VPRHYWFDIRYDTRIVIKTVFSGFPGRTVTEKVPNGFLGRQEHCPMCCDCGTLFHWTVNKTGQKQQHNGDNDGGDSGSGGDNDDGSSFASY